MDKHVSLAIIVSVLTLFYGIIFFGSIALVDQSLGGITNDFRGILFKTFSFLKVISGLILLLGIKLKNIKLFYPWIILNCITILLSLIMIIIIFLGLGEVTFGFTKKEAIVTGGIAIALIVVTCPALVFITNRFNLLSPSDPSDSG